MRSCFIIFKVAPPKVCLPTHSVQSTWEHSDFNGIYLSNLSIPDPHVAFYTLKTVEWEPTT